MDDKDINGKLNYEHGECENAILSAAQTSDTGMPPLSSSAAVNGGGPVRTDTLATFSRCKCVKCSVPPSKYLSFFVFCLFLFLFLFPFVVLTLMGN